MSQQPYAQLNSGAPPQQQYQQQQPPMHYGASPQGSPQQPYHGGAPMVPVNHHQQQPMMYQHQQGPPPMSPMMGGGVPPPQSPQFPMLWPRGVGIADRPNREDECSNGPCYCACCSTPVWYRDVAHTAMTDEQRVNQTCNGWETKADVLGTQLELRGAQPECCSCTSHVHVSENGRDIGKVALYQPCCEFGEAVLAEGFDAQGQSRFQRKENMCTRYSHWSGDACGYQELNWPLMSSISNMQLGTVTQRYHACMGCYPTWVGIKHFPQGLTPDDQKLLVAMIHARWWRTERDQKNNNNNSN